MMHIFNISCDSWSSFSAVATSACKECFRNVWDESEIITILQHHHWCNRMRLPVYLLIPQHLGKSGACKSSLCMLCIYLLNVSFYQRAQKYPPPPPLDRAILPGCEAWMHAVTCLHRIKTAHISLLYLELLNSLKDVLGFVCLFFLEKTLNLSHGSCT